MMENNETSANPLNFIRMKSSRSYPQKKHITYADGKSRHSSRSGMRQEPMFSTEELKNMKDVFRVDGT